MKHFNLYILIILALSLLACNNKHTQSNTANITVKKADIAKASKDTPQVVFFEKQYDFGTIADGEELMFYFKFINKGPGHLKIKKVEPSCGCTIVSTPKTDIPAGDTGVIIANFNSSGFSGYQYKIITVYTNAKDSMIDLVIKGIVK